MSLQILEKLFTSKSRARILDLYFKEQRPLYESEIALLGRLSRSAVQKELGNLKSIGVLNVSRTKTRTYYTLNKRFPYYIELRKMFFKRC